MCVVRLLCYQLDKTHQQLQNLVRTMERDKLEWERICLDLQSEKVEVETEMSRALELVKSQKDAMEREYRAKMEQIESENGAFKMFLKSGQIAEGRDGARVQGENGANRV